MAEFSVDILIPVYNEGKNIKNTLDSLSLYTKKIETIFKIQIIYDFEGDDTLPVIERIKDNYDFEIVLQKNLQRGVLNAIKTGFKTSMADYILVTMADMSDDYSILSAMIDNAKKGYDIVCASRYVKGGKLVGGPIFKQFLSRLAGITLHFFTGIPTHDATNSYKLYKKSMLDSMNIESNGGFEIGLEIIAKAFVKGYKISEVPTIWRDRTEGKSNFKLLKWLPKYLRWYFFLIKNVWFK